MLRSYFWGQKKKIFFYSKEVKEMKRMLEVKRDDFDESLEDIMNSINGILNKTGKGFETIENETEEEEEKKN